MRTVNFSIVFISALVVSMIICGCAGPGTAPDADTAAAELIQQSEEIVAAYSAHDVDKILSFMADDVESISNDGTSTYGKEGFRKELEEIFTIMPDLTMEAENIFAAGNRACVQWSIKGTYSGAQEGEEASAGKSLSFRGVSITEISEGKAVRSYVYYDSAPILIELGILQPPSQE